MKDWIAAFRFRTLPLALSSIFMGTLLATQKGMFDGVVFAFACLTTIFLQVLSNLANDLGDTQNGADSVEREGPKRAVQTGVISINAMKKAIGILVVLSLVSGCSLLWISFGVEYWKELLGFFVLGILAIVAAIKYTAGNNPYGYAGLGDISVFLFFGITGVSGSYFLFTHEFSWYTILPAITCGLFSVGVLNINNIRDIDSDKSAGKMSIPVRIGELNARRYHLTLLIVGVLSFGVFTVLSGAQNLWAWSFVLAMPLMIKNAVAVGFKKSRQELDPYLKQMAISTLMFVVAFGVGVILPILNS